MKKELFNGKQFNTINGIQYPDGFTRWLTDVAKVLQSEHGCFEGDLIIAENVNNFVDPKAWKCYFMDGYNPKYAVIEDFKNI